MRLRQLRCSMDAPGAAPSCAIRAAYFTPRTGEEPSAAKRTPNSSKTFRGASLKIKREHTSFRACCDCGRVYLRRVCAPPYLTILSCDSQCLAERQYGHLFSCWQYLCLLLFMPPRNHKATSRTDLSLYSSFTAASGS